MDHTLPIDHGCCTKYYHVRIDNKIKVKFHGKKKKINKNGYNTTLFPGGPPPQY
jgi:hypothetical protein